MSIRSVLETGICATATEERHLLSDWNNTRTEYPREKCVHELFTEQAQRTPEAVAVVFEDRQLTYARLNELAEDLAQQLRQIGVGPDVRVGLCLRRSLEMVIGMYGILKAGGAYVPMDPNYPAERLALMLEDAQVPVLVTEKALLESLPRTVCDVVCVAPVAASESLRRGTAGGGPGDGLFPRPALSSADILAAIDGNPGFRSPARAGARPGAQLTSDHLAYVIYTSGSTGKPKGVMIRHRNVVNFFTGMDLTIGREPGTWLAVTSISFDIHVLELLWTLTRGFKVVLQGDEAGGARAKRPSEQSTVPQLTAARDTGVASTNSTKTPIGHSNLVPPPAGDYGIADQILRHGVTHLQCTPSLARMMLQNPKTKAALREVKKFFFGGEALPAALVEELAGSGEIFNMYGPTETTVWSTVHPVTRQGGTTSIGRPIANTEIYILDAQLQPVPVGAEGELFIGGAGVTRGYLNRPELTDERFIRHPFSDDPEARLYRTGDLARYRADGNIEFLGRLDQQVKIRGHRIELGEIEATLRQHPQVQESAVSVWEAGPNDQRLVGYYVPKPGTQPATIELRRFLQAKLPDYMVPSAFVSLAALPLTPNGKLDRKALPKPGAPASMPASGRASGPAGRHAGTPSTSQVVRPAAPPTTLPLTEAQREIWYGSQMGEAVSCSFNQSVMLHLKGPLDVAQLTRTLSWLVGRHEALRVTFTPEGDAQQIHAQMAIEMPLIDLSLLPAEGRQEELQRLLREEAGEAFDLVKGPLLRARLITLGAQEHALLLTVHHIVCDGGSLGVLLEELGQRYSAGADATPLPPPAVSYSQFVREQEAASRSPNRAECESFWLGQFSSPPPALELPNDRPRPARRQFTGGCASLRLSSALSQELRRLSARQRCTPVTLLLAAYYVLAHRLSSQNDIVIGLPMTSRSGEGGENLVGHCVNFLPLRLKLEGDPPFTEHLNRVWEMLIKAQEHQNYTLGSLLQKLNLHRDSARMPLASVMFNLDWVQEPITLAGLKSEIKPNPYCQARFDLSFCVGDCEGSLELFSQYSAELFNHETMERWCRHYETLLASIIANPRQRLSELRLLPQADERRLLVDWAGPQPETIEAIAQALPIGVSAATLAALPCRFYVLDQYQHPCPVGVVGELCISGPSTLLGNGTAGITPVRDPFRPELAFVLHRTNLRARRLPDGRLELAAASKQPEEAAPAEPSTPVAETSAEMSPTEETLAQIWREVIVLEEVGRNDNFFDLGGHSLLATQVISRIAAAFNVDLPLRTMFETASLAELAAAIDRTALEQPGGATVITRRDRGSAARQIQERLEQLSDAELQKLLLNPNLSNLL